MGGDEDREGGGDEAHRSEEQVLVTRPGQTQAVKHQHSVVQMREMEREQMRGGGRREKRGIFSPRCFRHNY
jgi:hypothetical protein